MKQLAKDTVGRVAVLRGAGTWVTPSERAAHLDLGPLDGGRKRAVRCGSPIKDRVIAVLDLRDGHIVATDGTGVAKLELVERSKLSVLDRWSLPGELAWSAELAAAPSSDAIAVASDLRLGVFGSTSKIIHAEGSWDEHFIGVAFLNDSTLAVGRGDGRVELRDAATLEVQRTFSVLDASVMHLAALDEHILAVADDAARTGLLDVETGTWVELDLGRMKTSGLHVLDDGRLVVVGLSRRISLFEADRRVAEVDLGEELEDRYIQGSAVDGDTLLLACEQKGLWSLSVSALNGLAPPISLPAPASVIRDATTLVMRKTMLVQAIEDGRDITELIAPVLKTDDDEVLHAVFGALVRRKRLLPDAAEHLRSGNARVRYYVADFYGQLPELFSGRAAELKPVLDDPDPAVAAAALWSLGRLGDPSAAAWVVPLLEHPESHVRTTAIRSLLDLRVIDTVPTLCDAIRGGDGAVSVLAFLALWPDGTDALFAPLSRELVTQLAAGMSPEAILDALPVEATPEFRAGLAPEPYAETAEPRHPVLRIVYGLASRRGWPVTFDGTTLTFTTHDDAAAWWDRELRRHWA